MDPGENVCVCVCVCVSAAEENRIPGVPFFNRQPRKMTVEMRLAQKWDWERNSWRALLGSEKYLPKWSCPPLCPFVWVHYQQIVQHQQMRSKLTM